MQEQSFSQVSEQIETDSPGFLALVSDLKEKHPDYDEGMIYQMAWMRIQPVKEV